MSYQVKIESNQNTFVAESYESILEAAIRAGIPLNYGCSNGNCGLCKARIISGQAKPLRTHEYVIGEAEKIQGYVLMCSNACESDLLIAAEVATTTADIAVQDLQVKVRKIERVSDELAIVTTQVPRSTRLRFIAGQYMRVYDDQQRSHEYAIASCPCDDKRIEFHVRKLEDDPFSVMVFEHLSIGNWLNIQGPYGDFIIDESKECPLIMIAFDTGFAAIKSLLEHVTAQDKEREIYLYWLGCGDEGLYLNNLCRSWCDALDQMHYYPIHLAKEANEILDREYEGISLIEEKLSQELQAVAHLNDAETYVVAPEPVRKLVEQLLLQKGFIAQQFHHEVIRGNPNLRCIHDSM